MPPILSTRNASAERHVDARHVADAERDGHRIETAVGERQRFGIAFGKGDRLAEVTRFGALAADREHVGIDVAHRRPRLLAAGRDGAHRHVAGAAGDVEQRERPRFGRIERGDQRVLPGPMQAERHQIVHQVVARRDAVEHVVDQRLLVRKRHLA